MLKEIHGEEIRLYGFLLKQQGQNNSVQFATLDPHAQWVEVALAPKELREFNEKCPLNDGKQYCFIDAKAEVDTSSGKLVFLISEFDSIE